MESPPVGPEAVRQSIDSIVIITATLTSTLVTTQQPAELRLAPAPQTVGSTDNLTQALICKTICYPNERPLITNILASNSNSMRTSRGTNDYFQAIYLQAVNGRGKDSFPQEA